MSKTFSERGRCGWSSKDFLMIEYHDREWGVPAHDDTVLFEFLILEGAQAGLNWLTILQRREDYRRAFDSFDFGKVAKYNEQKISSLLHNEKIIKNRLKIESAVTNARAFLNVRREFGTFDRYIWQFVDGNPIKNSWASLDMIPSHTDISDKMSKDLVKRGFKFVGPTICYSYMQAVGMVNDHLVSCFRYNQV
ncbi:MAG: DNA-3-methyladenine glycosylase I [Thermoplasmatales archaeon]